MNVRIFRTLASLYKEIHQEIKEEKIAVLARSIDYIRLQDESPAMKVTVSYKDQKGKRAGDGASLNSVTLTVDDVR
ncbi:hypothetical protein PHJA_001937300 [Phtheirospermum japonicum]|uniref:Uncharacterized protein n=1 Tax=Phtheirospermum japonicum TaxID=374723 RepID=A0A830CI73_9LAMI|nr:hypothetical protein PHJA_001937300 [Phtheirospermum japonicum]